MSGLPDHNFPAFFEAAAQLRALGYDVFNPAENDGPNLECALRNVRTKPLGSWEDYLRRDLKILLDCDELVYLEGIDRSRGAQLEMYVASQLQMPVRRFASVLLVAGLAAC
jgi:uncharacterized protein DUF4406